MYSHADFTGSPWEIGNKREKALADGLRRFAKHHGYVFKEPLQIDSIGEMNLFIKDGTFGPSMELIRHHNPRCGMYPTKHMCQENSWCMMNHFDVERLLEEWEATV